MISQSPPSQPERLSRGSLLIVDDEPSIPIALSQTLSRMGFELLEAVSGADALAGDDVPT